MKSIKIILIVLILTITALIFSGCGGGGSVTPPISDNTDDSDSEEIELIEIASKEINLEEGGVIEVMDPNSELYGLKLTIEPLKNIRENKENPIFTIIKFFLSPDVASCRLPDYQGFLITPFAIKSDFTNVLFGKLEIPYYMEQLINAGVAINSTVKLCRVPTQSCSWEEVSQDKYIVENNVVNIPIGTGDLGYSYTLTVNNTAIPHPSKNPQPGDLLYKSSKWGTNEGWLPGHVGIYVGERYNEEDGKYNVIEAQWPVVKRSYYGPISAFSHDCIYIGAREPEGGLSHQKRNLIIAFAEGVVGTAYATFQTASSMFWTGLGRGELVKGDNGKFNCVGLAEKAYQLVGIDLVSNYDEGNVIHGPYHILTPAEQWNKTVSASGVLVQNIPPKISSLEITPESPVGVNSSVSITCTASDQDGDLLTYIWDKNGGTFEGSTLELPITKGKSIIWVAPNKEDEYKITCKVIDNYGGEDSKSIDVLVGGLTTNHPPNIISSPVTSATKGQPYSYDVNATDSDGDIPVYSLTTKPSGMTINSSTGLITWTPTATGSFGVTVKVSDGELFDTQSFTITVEETGTIPPPDAPTSLSPGTTSAPGPYINTLTPTLQWQAVSNADYYNLSVSIYPYEYENIIYYNQQVYGNSITVPNGELEAGKKYRWNIRAYNSAGGYSEYSSDYYFQTESPPSSQIERITNSSFSSGTSGWTLAGDFWAGTNFSNYHTSPGYAAGGVDSAGLPKNGALGWMYQTVAIPSGATSATLSFWYNITSEETGSTAYDVLNVTIQNSSGNYLGTVATLSNLNKSSLGSYSKVTFNITSYKGQTIRVHFLASTDSSVYTVFRIDDVSLMSDG